MSRVGQSPVAIPDGVEVSTAAGVLTAKGKLGTMVVPLSDEVTVSVENGNVVVKNQSDSHHSRAMWGTMRSLVSNAVTGVSEGFTRRLEVNGVGYRAQLQGNNLNLQLGYSHDIVYKPAEGIKISVEGDRGSIIAVTGVDKQVVGQAASDIRSFRKPEPYKGKGIRYENEIVLRKEGKKK